MELYKITIKNNLKIILSIQYFIVFISLVFYMINLMNSCYFSYVFLAYILIFCFLYISFISIKIFRLFNAFNIFLFGYFMFQISALFVSLDTLNERIFMQYDFEFTKEQMNNTICANMIIINSMFLGCIFSVIYNPFSERMNHKLNTSEHLRNWGGFIFMVFLPLTILKFILEIKLVFTEGYYAYYTSSLSIPTYISISRFFFEIGYFIFVASLPSKAQFVKMSKIYLLIMSLFVLVGVRNRIVLSFIFVLWFYYRFYSLKSPKIILILLISVLSIFLLLFVQFARQSGVFLLTDERSIWSYFFYAQSTNFYILPLFQYYNLNSDIPFILAPIFNIDSSSYNPESMSNLLGNVVAYNISPIEFNEGHGLGSSFIAELYDLGIIIMLPISILLGYSIALYDRCVSSSRILLVVSFYIITNCVYISRSSLFRNIYMILFVIILLCVILKIKYPFKKII